MNTSGDDADRTYKLDVSGDPDTVYQFAKARNVNINHHYPDAKGRPRRVPRELPAYSPRFHNRSGEITILDQLVEENSDLRAARVLLVDGETGVGKTDLVARWAQPLAIRFSDGFVYCDLAEYMPDETVDTVEVLGSLLASLGMARDDMMDTAEGRARQWRSITHDLKLLIVLDNIEDPALLARLQPASPSATVVLISRVNAAAFVAEGAELIEIAPLNATHSKELLAKVCGRQRLEAEPEAVNGLLDLCAGRPGTIALLGGCIATSKTLSLAQLLRDITTESRGRSHETAALIAKRVVIASLPQSVGELYRRLCGHTGEDFGLELAEALTGTGDAGRLLAKLENEQLVVPKSPGRWRVPKEEPDDPELVRPILDWYLAMARRADVKAMGRHRLRLSRVDESKSHDPQWSSKRTALDWLELELPNLIALQKFAVDQGWDADAVALEESLWVLYLRRSFPGFQETTSRLAVEAAVRLSDRGLESRMRAQRGRCLWQRKAYREALTESLRARELAQGNDNLEASAAEMTGRVYLRLGRWSEAIAAFEFALRIYEERDYPRGAALARQFLAQAYAGADEYAKARSLLLLALDGFVDCEATGDQGRALLDLARVSQCLGDRESALSALDEAAVHLADNGMHQRLAEAHTLRGDILLCLHRNDAARAAWRQALDIQLCQHNGDGPEASQLRAKLAAP